MQGKVFELEGTFLASQWGTLSLRSQEMHCLWNICGLRRYLVCLLRITPQGKTNAYGIS